MVSGMRVLSWSAVLLSAVAVAPTASAATKCENLASLELSDVSSITAKSFPGGTFQPPDPAGFVPDAYAAACICANTQPAGVL